MSNELATITGLAETTLSLLSPTQKGWLKLEYDKRNTFQNLQGFELKVQEELKDITKLDALEDLPKVQEKLKAAKAVIAEMKDCRLQFTRVIDEKIVQPAMEFEKRSAELIPSVEAHELQLRIRVNQKNDEFAAEQREASALRAHITNEYYRIATEYRLKLKQEIAQTKMAALESSIPVASIPELLLTLKEALSQIEKPKFVVFPRKLVNDAKAKEIFLSVPAYDHTVDLSNAIAEADKEFALYENDLANAKQAIAAIDEQYNAQAEEMTESLAAEVATNNLVAQAEPLEMSGGPKIKTTMVPVVVESEQFAVAVMAAAIKNWNHIKGSLRVKNWSKLTVQQMADALGKYVTDNPGVTITGIQFTVKVK